LTICDAAAGDGGGGGGADKTAQLVHLLELKHLMHHSIRLWKPKALDVSSLQPVSQNQASDCLLVDDQYWFLPSILPKYYPELAQIWPEVLPADLLQVTRVYHVLHLPNELFDRLLVSLLQVPDCQLIAMWKSGAIVTSSGLCLGVCQQHTDSLEHLLRGAEIAQQMPMILHIWRSIDKSPRLYFASVCLLEVVLYCES
jgi:hypothetical protein